MFHVKHKTENMVKTGFKIACPKVIELGGILKNIAAVALTEVGTEVVFRPREDIKQSSAKLQLPKSLQKDGLQETLVEILSHAIDNLKIKMNHDIHVIDKLEPGVEEKFSSIFYGIWRKNKHIAETEQDLLELLHELSKPFNLNPLMISTAILGGLRISQSPLHLNGIRKSLPKGMPWLLIKSEDFTNEFKEEVSKRDHSEKIRLAAFMQGSLFSDLKNLEFGLAGIDKPEYLNKAIGFDKTPDDQWVYLIFKNHTDLNDFIMANNIMETSRKTHEYLITEISEEGIKIS